MYSFADHSRRCFEAAQAGIVLRQYVQVKVGKETACGRLVDFVTTPNQVDLWCVDLLSPFRGLFYVVPGRVRACSGIDGRCSCAEEAAEAPAKALAERAQAGASEAERGLAC